MLAIRCMVDLAVESRSWSPTKDLVFHSNSREARVTTSIAVRTDLRRIVPLLMLVVATGHFNRIAISVAGNERIVPGLGVKADDMGMIYSAFLLAYTLAMLPGGWFIDRFGPRVGLMVLLFGSTAFVVLTGGVGFLATGAASVWWGLLVVRSFLGLMNAPLHPASARMVFEHLPPESRAMANGLVTGAACAGIAATYVAFGLLIDAFDWPVAFLISGGLTFLVALVWTFGTRPTGDASDLIANSITTELRPGGPPARAPPPERDLFDS